MNRVEVLDDNEKEMRYVFHCPGCKEGHWFRTRGPQPVWSFNGDLEKPTVRASILVGKDDPARRCHSFITDGHIAFLNDCFHELRGQTVELGLPW